MGIGTCGETVVKVESELPPSVFEIFGKELTEWSTGLQSKSKKGSTKWFSIFEVGIKRKNKSKFRRNRKTASPMSYAWLMDIL